MRIRKRQLPLPLAFSSGPRPVSDPLHAHAPPTVSNPMEKEQQEHIEDNTRERCEFDAETSNGVVPQSTSSPQVVGRWGEREREFPLKKRRSDDHNNNGNKKMKKKQEEHQSKMGLNLAGKRKSRGGALMEGSRCSRVNGRGWRCCQQTLVGYSLCEHHLGKGRLRSMNSVRSRSSAATVVEKEDNKKPSPSPSPRPPLTLTSKKRTKLGVVKARSISSLLGQPDSVMALAPPPPLPPTPPDDNIDGKKL
ncbi:uncharacterized protein LOC111436877 isoform X1 [Cucurbita moschata]|uniref:Uncharacterized protein LOC111436877 isoform X1 n=1 Tax=Cucurbita moschata TaxID=3662 RepID=A0A6J1EWY8_CUCMO|nr:uncharacterized protein LOC111436877 isoform X1 [Cucurbita moschata]